MIRSGILAAAALAIGFTAAPAAADTVTYVGYALTNAKSVTITAPISATVNAGRIVLDNVKINGVNSADINAWCIDLNNTLSGQGTYGFGALSDAATANKLNALLNGAALSALDLTSGNNSAALQVAIWKTVSPSYTMNTSVTNGTSINNLSNTFLGYVNDTNNSVWKASSTSTIVTLDPIPTGSTQRLVTLIPTGGGNNNTSTPEPASMALVGVGLAGIGLARRRRRTLH